MKLIFDSKGTSEENPIIDLLLFLVVWALACVSFLFFLFIGGFILVTKIF